MFFSAPVKEWIRAQGLLSSIEHRFREEWGQVLAAAQPHLLNQGWSCRLLGAPPDVLQAYRPRWPGGSQAVHYEVWCGEPFRFQSRE